MQIARIVFEVWLSHKRVISKTGLFIKETPWDESFSMLSILKI